MHIDNLVTLLSMEKAKTFPTPSLPSSMVVDDSPLEGEAVSTYRRAVGIALYLCPDRWDIQRDVQLLSRKLKEPTQHEWKRLVRVVRYLKGTRSAGVRMRKPTQTAKNVVQLDMFSDTDFAGCLETRRAMTCGLYFVDGQPIYGFARRQGVQSTSSGEAELYGASSVAFDGRLIKELLEWLGFSVVYHLHVDSSSAKAMINRDGVGNVKHLDVRALWLQQEREKNGLKVKRVPGERNPADLGTKAHPVARFELLKQLCGITDCSAIDRAMEVGIHAIEAWGAKPSSVNNGRGLLARMAALSALLVPARGESVAPWRRRAQLAAAVRRGGSWLCWAGSWRWSLWPGARSWR